MLRRSTTAPMASFRVGCVSVAAPPLRRAVCREAQKGSAHLKVSRIGRRSEIVRLSHSSPVRLLPMATSAAEQRSGTAWCALGSFGGGFLGGDEVDVSVDVGPNSTLGLTTQASTKVYQAKEDGHAAVQRLEASVGSGGLLVLSPDPLVPFAQSSYLQRLRFSLEPGSSAVVVDWLGAGRVAKGECWAFKEYRSQLEFMWSEGHHQAHPTEDEDFSHLIESLQLRGRDLPAPGFDAAVTVFALGPRAQAVAERLQLMGLGLAERRGARVVEHVASSCPNLMGKAVMGVTNSQRGTTARLMAEKSEDVYRILHHCLSPLAQELGVEPYADRVHGMAARSTTPRKEAVAETVRTGSSPRSLDPLDLNLDLRKSLVLCQLTDATLPVGGFAHSNGIEAASQLGLFGLEEESLQSLVFLGCRSMLRLQGRFVKLAYELGDQDSQRWQQLDANLHAHLVSNGVACRASALQGAGLLRVGRQWGPQPLPKKGHYATAFGLLAARLLLGEAAALSAFTYCTVRDSLSAAVRLNLVGPLRAVELQASILRDLEEELLHLIDVEQQPAGCAPLLDCVHSGHDLLEARLFLT